MPVRSATLSPHSLPIGGGGAQADDEHGTHRLIQVDPNWRIETIHPDVLAMFAIADRTMAELEGTVLWDAFPGWIGTAAERKLRTAMHRRTPDDFELHYPASGMSIDVRLRPADTSLAIQLRDTTPARAPGESMARSRDRAEAPQITDTLPVPVANLACAFDRAGRLTHASVALLDRWKVRLPEAKGRTVLELNYPPALGERLHRQIQRVIATGEPVTDQVTYPVPGGRTESHEHIFSPLLGEDGTVHGVAGAIRIVAGPPTVAPKPVAPRIDGEVQRAKVLGELAADVFAADPGRLPLTALFERIGTAIGAECHFHHTVVEGRSWLRLECSAGLEPELLGALNELPFGRELPGLVAQHRRPMILHDLQKNPTLEGAALRDLQLDACAGHPLLAGDRLLGTLLFGTRWRPRFTEDELHFLQSAAALVAARLSGESAAAQAEQKAEPAARAAVLKEEFLNAVVQELRVPLESTLLQIRALAGQAGVPEHLRFELEAIARNLTTESRLVNDLLDLTRIARGELSIEHNFVNLHAVLRDALGSVKPELAEHGIVLAMNVPDVAPQVRGDAVRLQQVFWNLLKRAIRSSPRGGIVSVRLSLTPSLHAAVTITDSGHPLPPEQTQRALEPWSLAATEADEAGAGGPRGFGMATVRKIVELHSGRIHVGPPKTDGGTSFTVELPLAPETGRAGKEPDAARGRPAKRTPAHTQQRKILLVEDQPDTREALLVLLRQWKHEVIVATSVREARGLARMHPFDLVISAVSLSDGSGYELMAGLRLDHGLSGIALVGNGTEQDSALGRSAGFAARLAKPVSIEALEKALAAVLPTN
ncbi:ATP-binding protein [Opitutus terrae]|uniref:histidine kinase n=1 Tax=Opitutus terrae (strain DSM 11246 / JCM 15787 / PB90-1) TaxID=452637 RepID=B1ZN95_OPITP|nr:ATP-binding protein [Opitutus terrae]ACB73464.1 multi-sensor hybrid histidine kinase [Opitutus terrae PB90-1]